MKMDPYLTPYRKLNSKWLKTKFKDLNLTFKHKTPKRKYREKLYDFGFKSNFLYMTTKAQATKAKLELDPT